LEQSRGLKPTPESTLAYYWQFLDNGKDREFIESLFFTRIQQSEELIPLLNGLLLKAINARYSQKVAEELIKAEENEKLVKRKKKKHNKKVQELQQCACCAQNINAKTSIMNCEINKFTKQLANSLIHKTLLALNANVSTCNSCHNNTINTPNPSNHNENTSTINDSSLKQHRLLEYETSVSVVSDTTRKCRFPSSLIKKNRCTSNSREKGQKQQEAQISEITTLLDSNTDFESVADSVYEGSLKNNKQSKNKVEPPVFNNKKERNLSHEKYEPDQKEDKKVNECEDFIEVKRKRSVKEGSYITNSACKSSVLKSKKVKNSTNNTVAEQKNKERCVVTNTIKEEKKKLENNKKIAEKNLIITNNVGVIVNPNVINIKKDPEKVLEKKLTKEISCFMDTLRPKLEEIRVFRGLVLKRLRFILACLFPRKKSLFSL